MTRYSISTISLPSQRTVPVNWTTSRRCVRSHRRGIDPRGGQECRLTKKESFRTPEFQCSCRTKRHHQQTRMTVYPPLYPAFYRPRPSWRSFPPSGISEQRIPEASLPAFVIASPVVQICAPAKETQSEHRDGPFSTSRLSILPRMVLCDPVK